MQPLQMQLDDLRAEVEGMEREEFMARYPGVFLVTTGVLSAEVRAAVRLGSTLSLASPPRLSPDATQDSELDGRLFFLEPDGSEQGLTIGRGRGSDIVIPESSVSEKHCLLKVSDLGVAVVDLQSTNGTTVNLQRLASGEEAPLTDEDTLTLGRYSLQLMEPGTLYGALTMLQTIPSSER